MFITMLIMYLNPREICLNLNISMLAYNTHRHINYYYCRLTALLPVKHGPSSLRGASTTAMPQASTSPFFKFSYKALGARLTSLTVVVKYLQSNNTSDTKIKSRSRLGYFGFLKAAGELR